MNTIQILIVAFFILTYAYLILKIWDDIRDARRERKAIRYEITAIDIVDFTSMPARAKNGRFLPKDKGGPVDVSDQLFPKRGKDGKFLPKTKRPL